MNEHFQVGPVAGEVVLLEAETVEATEFAAFGVRPVRKIVVRTLLNRELRVW